MTGAVGENAPSAALTLAPSTGTVQINARLRASM